ncbi:MAG: Imm63 family immunity protein [Actinomycetota bacterium]
MDGGYRDPLSHRELPSQIPKGVSWVDAVPAALAWAGAGAHREVLVEAAGCYRGDVMFGPVPGRPNLDDVDRWLHVLAEGIEASPSDLPTVGRPADGARPHVEYAERGLAYVVVERGVELARTETLDGLEVLALSFMDTTQVMASRWEAQHRHPGEDVRRRLFAKQLVLLDALHPAWRRRRIAELGTVLSDVGLDPDSAADVVAQAE